MHDVTAITNLLHRYAELVDAGDFAGVGDLMAHCSMVYGPERVQGPSGATEIAARYEAMIILYPDGTPRTRHIMTNPIIEVAGDQATARSSYTVMQQVDDDPLQTVIVGRYVDQLERIDGSWQITERQFLADLTGDLSRHIG